MIDDDYIDDSELNDISIMMRKKVCECDDECVTDQRSLFVCNCACHYD